MPESQRIWTFARAKARLSEVIERTLTEGPQIITRRGRRVFVVAAEEFEKKVKREGSLSKFFATSPLRGSRLRRLKKARNKPRNIKL
jgi:prevent-host-death family protein